MIAGYLTFEELKLITGFDEKFLSKLIVSGMKYHVIHLDKSEFGKRTAINKCLFRIDEVEEWIKLHVY